MIEKVQLEGCQQMLLLRELSPGQQQQQQQQHLTPLSLYAINYTFPQLKLASGLELQHYKSVLF